MLLTCKKVGCLNPENNPIQNEEKFMASKRKRDIMECTLCTSNMFVVHNKKEDQYCVSMN